ncbi:MAG: hypothetical protein LAO22_20735 [Acidobacteriia bacterium]|nr:hypothetical protein [Terriglobia bacterium]
MRNTAFVVMLLCLIRVAVPRIAQVDTGTVVGTITDSNGALSPRPRLRRLKWIRSSPMALDLPV